MSEQALIVRPIDVTAAMVTSSTFPETVPTAWSSLTNYSAGTRVSVLQSGTTYFVYESLQSSNTNHAPASSPTWWTYVGTVYPAYSSGTTYFDGQIVTDTANHRLYQASSSSLKLPFTFRSLQDTFTSPGHGLVDTDQLTLDFTPSSVASGFSESVVYYVVNATTDTFKLSATSGGAAINGGLNSNIHYGFAYPNPNIGYALTDTNHWLDVGASGPYGMFDKRNFTTSTAVGRVQVVLSNVGRVDSLGLLGLSGVKTVMIEATGTGGPTRTNLLPRSQEFDHGNWIKGGGGSLSANATAAPDGTLTADQCTFPNLAYQRVAASAGAVYTGSIYAKKNTMASIRFGLIENTGTKEILYDFVFDTQVLALNANTGWTNVSADYTDVGGGWYRLDVTGTTPVGTTAAGVIFRSPSGGSFFIWGAQFEAGAGATAYIPTVATSASSTTYLSYSESFELTDDSFSDDWYSGIYVEPVYKDSLVVTDIPPEAGLVLTVTLTGPTMADPIAVGSLLLGLSKCIGSALVGSSTRITNYSNLNRDEFGNVDLVERAYAKGGRFDVRVPAEKHDGVQSLLAQYRATPLLWVMAREFVSTQIFAVYNDFELTFGTPDSRLSLSLEGLT